MVDGVKDAVKKVDRTVSDAAVKGIEVGRKLTPSLLFAPLRNPKRRWEEEGVQTSHLSYFPLHLSKFPC